MELIGLLYFQKIVMNFDSISIEIGYDMQIFIPNSYTGDDENELLVVKGNNVISFEIRTNRWGELMFYTDKIENYWNVQFNNSIVPEGVYSTFSAYGNDAQFINRMGVVNVLRINIFRCDFCRCYTHYTSNTFTSSLRV